MAEYTPRKLNPLHPEQQKKLKKREECDYMWGREVERTPAYGMQTLFLPKPYSFKMINKIRPEHCNHLYFGANKGFPTHKLSADEWLSWESTIRFFLDAGFWCTLDIPAHQWEDTLETCLVEYPRFILMVSLELPYIAQSGYNACLKLDDKSIEGHNGGVWVHELHELRDRTKFTRWDDYRNDKTGNFKMPQAENK